MIKSKTRKYWRLKTKEWRDNMIKCHPLKYKRLMKKYRNKNGLKNRLNWKYGITTNIYFNKLQIQNNKCAICLNEDIRRLSVDHDHKSGKIRGLLCIKCNSGLGLFKDDRRLISRALRYLIKWKS